MDLGYLERLYETVFHRKSEQSCKEPNRKSHLQGHLGGSVADRLPLAQVMILGFPDPVLHQAPPHGEPPSPSADVSASLCVSHE